MIAPRSRTLLAWLLRAICLATVPGLLPATASASLKVCNVTPHRVNIALAHDTAGSWEARGWWPVDAGDCQVVIQTPLQRPQYYLLAVSAGSSRSWGNQREFCIVPGQRFAIAGADAQPCAGAGQQARQFFAVDVGEDESFTQTLHCRSCDPAEFRQAAAALISTSVRSVAETSRAGIVAGADTTTMYQSNRQQLQVLDRSLRLLQAVAGEESRIRELLVLRGQYHLQTGRQGVQIDPNYDELSDYETAINDFRGAMAAFPAEGDGERETNITWAESQLRAGEYSQARGILNTLF